MTSNPTTGARTFSDLALPPSLQQVVLELGFTALTPIQAQSIPPLLAGKDLVGQSKTGSGKTAAFALPILSRLRPGGRRPRALVLCPTRELCAQVAREIRRFGRRQPGLNVLVVSGGVPAGPQRAALERGVHIVVGTPGRVLDMIGRGKLDLAGIDGVVLDEADRMLDMGFQPDIEAILAQCPPSRQTVFFSATFPDSIAAMSSLYQRQPLRIVIEDQPAADAPKILQLRCDTTRDDKLASLHRLLDEQRPDAAIVFCNHKATVDDIAAYLLSEGHSAAGLHGGLGQLERDQVLAKFRNHSVRVLIATDVAARGLDIEHLDAVVNFDLPQKPEVYVHRIGRTGRAGRSGLAISLVTPEDLFRLERIEEVCGRPLERYGAHARDTNTGEEPAEFTGKTQLAAMETLRIFGGRKDKMRPSDVLGALTGDAAGLDGSMIGKIEIHDHFTYVAVAKDVVHTAVRGLREGRIKGRKFQVELLR